MKPPLDRCDRINECKSHTCTHYAPHRHDDFSCGWGLCRSLKKHAECIPYFDEYEFISESEMEI